MNQILNFLNNNTLVKHFFYFLGSQKFNLSSAVMLLLSFNHFRNKIIYNSILQLMLYPPKKRAYSP